MTCKFRQNWCKVQISSTVLLVFSGDNGKLPVGCCTAKKSHETLSCDSSVTLRDMCTNNNSELLVCYVLMLVVFRTPT